MDTWSEFQKYVFISRYARFNPDEGRREKWPETVDRYFNFFRTHIKERCGVELDEQLLAECQQAILGHQVMPSMRCLMSAGKALQRDEMAGFNCAYLAIDDKRAFAEALYILMVGTGVGFSVERQYICKLPEIPEKLYESETVVTVSDSKIGWAKALNELISILYMGSIPKIDTSKVRPAGAILRTFGGRASGPEPLNNLFKFVIEIFKESVGRKLTSIECHDIMCMIGNIVVVGGVRRAALISLSNLSDDRMRDAKSGQWWMITPWRRLANNSAVYTDRKPTMSVYMKEWQSLYESKSGERGIFSRWAATNIIKRSNEFRRAQFEGVAGIRYRETDGIEFGCNPCVEILLRNGETCNLTEVIVRREDTLETLLKKVHIATVLGVMQSTLTDYRFLSRKWSQNATDERLLGVSLTGIMDHPVLAGDFGTDKLREWLTELRIRCIQTNIWMAQKLGIPMSTAATCVKPSGTVSSKVNSAAGLHGRHSPFYLRTVRSDIKDPCARLMIETGVHCEPDITDPMNTLVFTFPEKSPAGSRLRTDMNAIQQLEMWLVYQKYWCEHKPSVTVSVREEEWMRVGSWVFDNFDYASGISFLPFDGHVYQQAPYQEVDESTYNEWVGKTPVVDWSKLEAYESEDMTKGSQELACTSKEGCSL